MPPSASLTIWSTSVDGALLQALHMGSRDRMCLAMRCHGLPRKRAVGLPVGISWLALKEAAANKRKQHERP